MGNFLTIRGIDEKDSIQCFLVRAGIAFWLF